MTKRQRNSAMAVAGVLVAAAALSVRGSASGRAQVREIAVVGDQFSFSPSSIEVQKDDVVRVSFTAKDIAHSFSIDVPYRISKRAGPGHSVVFEFRADEAGRFRYYCNLTQDERCRKMTGVLVVR
jgi:heme/copper-type cytochrome/quinol oxidase subunit 2